MTADELQTMRNCRMNLFRCTAPNCHAVLSSVNKNFRDLRSPAIFSTDHHGAKYLIFQPEIVTVCIHL
jgi:hypothetical protein